MTTTITVAEFLRDLGGRTQAEIHALMIEHDVRGRRGHGWACPMARLAHAVTGRSDLHFTKRDVRVDRTYVRLPASVRQFIRDFDDGAYDDLLDESGGTT